MRGDERWAEGSFPVNDVRNHCGLIGWEEANKNASQLALTDLSEHAAPTVTFFRQETPTMTSIIRIGLGAALAASLFCGTALAEDPADAAIARACKWDIKKFAATAKPDEIKSVLTKYIEKLSAECRIAVEASN
jgi:hypothetical protein